jgi:ubiquinone/menaquinone biosynthesis C-methylase UbiE
LEHLGRWDQEKVWSEMFRVLKPGGKMEHIVPNVEWAATKITDGQIDEHVYNVLYGAQEEHGYARELNTHFFGYTPAIGKELAEGCGLTNVKIKSYKDDENLGYNLIITGEKP